MNEVDQAKLLALTLKYTKSEIDRLSEELKGLIAKPVLVEGPPGVEGPQGPVGPQGPTGDPGMRGSRGDRGQRGEPGEDGISITSVIVENNELFVTLSNDVELNLGNVQGPQGDQGIQGEVGPQGVIGEQGPIGPQGIQGIQGEKGDKGDKGDIGLTGPRGIQGVEGPQGIQGDKGDRGEQGERGEKGDTGPQGEAGPKGEKGDIGPQGPRGLKGDQGEKGDTGPQGPAGIDGESPDIAPVEKKLLKLFEDFRSSVSTQISRINMGGSSSGGGEVNLLRLDDVDTTNLADSRYLRYNSSTGKLEFVAVSPGGGASSFSELTGFLDSDQISNNTIVVSKFTNDAGYITTYNVTSDDVTQYQANLSITESQITDLQSYLTTVAFSDLTSTPTTLAGYGITDSFSGSYTDLTDKPTIPSDVADLTDNANTIPTDVSDLTDTTNLLAAVSLGDSLDISVDNASGVNYKVVAFDNNANTVLASSKNINQISRVCGILDGNGNLVVNGLLLNTNWNWTPNQNLYLGDNGNIVTSSTIPDAAFSIQVGNALTATKIYVKLGTPVAL